MEKPGAISRAGLVPVVSRRGLSVSPTGSANLAGCGLVCKPLGFVRRGGSRRNNVSFARIGGQKGYSMSFSHMAQVRDIRGLSPSERALLYVLADFAASEGVEFGEAWPSQATLAEVLEVSERYVRGLLASLEAKGHITRRPGDRRGLRASSDRISVLPGRVARRSAASGPRRSIAPRRPGAARVSSGTMVPVATGTMVPPNLSRETIPLNPPPSLPRLPLESGGAVKAFDPSSLTRFQRSEVLAGRSVLVAGSMIRPDAPEWPALALAVRALL